MADISLNYDDPTVFAKCDRCDTGGRKGRKVKPTYFGKAFTERAFKKGPVCENCNGELRELYRVGRD